MRDSEEDQLVGIFVNSYYVINCMQMIYKDARSGEIYYAPEYGRCFMHRETQDIVITYKKTELMDN